MNKGLARFLSIAFIVILLIEIFGSMVVQKNKEKEEAKEQFDHYELKEYTPEEEEELIARLYPDVSDKEYTENMMYAFSQSILLAKTMDNYDTFANNIDDEYLSMLIGRDNGLAGKEIYKFLTKNMTPTKSSLIPESIDDDKQVFLVKINMLEKRDPLQYEFKIENKKIVMITERE